MNIDNVFVWLLGLLCVDIKCVNDEDEYKRPQFKLQHWLGVKQHTNTYYCDRREWRRRRINERN